VAEHLAHDRQDVVDPARSELSDPLPFPVTNSAPAHTQTLAELRLEPLDLRSDLIERHLPDERLDVMVDDAPLGCLLRRLVVVLQVDLETVFGKLGNGWNSRFLLDLLLGLLLDLLSAVRAVKQRLPELVLVLVSPALGLHG